MSLSMPGPLSRSSHLCVGVSAGVRRGVPRHVQGDPEEEPLDQQSAPVRPGQRGAGPAGGHHPGGRGVRGVPLRGLGGGRPRGAARREQAGPRGAPAGGAGRPGLRLAPLRRPGGRPQLQGPHPLQSRQTRKSSEQRSETFSQPEVSERISRSRAATDD